MTTVEIKPGLRLVCAIPDGTWLREGQTYTVREVWPSGLRGDVLVDVSEGGGLPLFGMFRFKLAADT